MKVTLYQAAETVRELLEQIDPETGELPPEFETAHKLVETKAQAVAAWVLSNEAEAMFVEEHAKAMLEKVKSARKRSNFIRQYLADHMKLAGITEIKSDDGTFKAKLEIERDESVEIFDEAQLEGGYLKSKTTFTPDKTLISKAIKVGIEVPGARLIKKDRLTLK